MRKCFAFCCLFAEVSLYAEEPWRIDVDADVPAGTWRALHGINKGPLAPGGLVDVTEAQRALQLPWTRLHDCQWPVPDVVDLHVISPNAAADPAAPESYDFAKTESHLNEWNFLPEKSWVPLMKSAAPAAHQAAYETHGGAKRRGVH